MEPSMFEKICAVTDDSAHGAAAGRAASELSAALGAELITSRQEPNGHREDRAWRLARALGRAVQARTPAPRRFTALVDDLRDSDCDLVVIGALEAGDGTGETIGATCERLLRRLGKDVLVVRDPEPPADGKIAVCIDGSPRSYAGLMAAIELGRATGRAVECVAVYDPYLHYTLFNGIVNVLTREAEAVFKFKDQEKLHEEIIDTGLAKIYQAHLEVARQLGREQGVELEITLLDGKAFEKVLKLVRATRPWLLVVGRIGVHSGDDMDIGATSENLLRMAPCNVLVTSSKYVPRVDIQAEESVEWTPDARKVMERVPSWVRGVATTSILRWAIERGHSVITAKVINQAMGDLLPPGAAQAMGYVAEEVAIQKDNLEVGNTYLCGRCGYAAKDFRPVTCPVCKEGGAQFEEINRETLQSLGRLKEGALEVEETFDGRKLTWTGEAKEVLRRVPSGYQRRRSKARIEKTARVRGLDTVTRDFALDIVQQDLAETSYLTPRGEALAIEVKAEEKSDDLVTRPRDGSPLPWTDAAWSRIGRVPVGFMRDATRGKVEEFAAAKGVTEVNLALCEEGIAEGRRMMADMIAQYGKDKSKVRDAVVGKPAWTGEAEKKVEEAVERTAAAGKFAPERAEQLARGVAETRAAEKNMEDISQAFMAKLGKQLGYGHPLSELTTEHQFTWTPEALARLETVPAFCREMAKWRVEWTAVKKDLGRVITPEIMDVKFGMWGEVSEEILAAQGKGMEWAPETLARLEKIPDFVRGQVIQSVEGNARLWGVSRVDNSVLDQVIRKWIETGDFHEGKYGYKAR